MDVLPSLGVLPVDLPVAQELRVVHRRPQRRGEEGCDPGAGDAHLHHPVLPQVRLENNYAGKACRQTLCCLLDFILVFVSLRNLPTE